MNKELNHTKNSQQKRRLAGGKRQPSGNLLVLSCIGFALACIALFMAYSFGGLFFINNRLQSSADEIALAGAKKLNDKDRIGQMNNMVARCRQLVYSSRKDVDDTHNINPDLEDFAKPLLDESRDSADLLERERQNIARLADIEARQAMQQRFNDIKPTYTMVLPWMIIKEPRLADVKFGRGKGVESNVEEIKGFKELQDHDATSGYIPNKSGLKLYQADAPQGLQLPGADSDLQFHISSLPAPVDGIIAPSRVILSDKQLDHKTGSVPSVVRVSLQLDVETGLGFKTGAKMYSTGVASTTGGCPQQ